MSDRGSPGEAAAQAVAVPAESRGQTWQRITQCPAEYGIGVVAPASRPERIVLRHAGQGDLRANKGRPVRVARFLHPIDEDEALRILVRILAHGPIECILLAGHRGQFRAIAAAFLSRWRKNPRSKRTDTSPLRARRSVLVPFL